MSSQYWTAWVYATSDVFHRAWDEFLANLHDDASWDYDQQGDAEWLITRTRSLNEYGDEGHKGDIGYGRYSGLEDAIQRIDSELEAERSTLLPKLKTHLGGKTQKSYRATLHNRLVKYELTKIHNGYMSLSISVLTTKKSSGVPLSKTKQ